MNGSDVIELFEQHGVEFRLSALVDGEEVAHYTKPSMDMLEEHMTEIEQDALLEIRQRDQGFTEEEWA